VQLSVKNSNKVCVLVIIVVVVVQWSLPLLSDNYALTSFLLILPDVVKEYFLIGGSGLYDGRMDERMMNVCPTTHIRAIIDNN